MSIDASTFVILLISALAYLGLFAIIFRRDEAWGAERWAAALTVWSALESGVFALSATHTRFLGVAPAVWQILASAGALFLLGLITFRFLEIERPLRRLIALPVAAVLLLWIDNFNAGQPLFNYNWRNAALHNGGWSAVAAIGLWAVFGLALIGQTLYSISESRFPLQANRRMWWLIAIPIMLGGEAAALWGTPLVSAIGQAVRLAGVVIITYVVITLKLIDIRGIARSIIGDGLVISFTIVMSLLAVALSVVAFTQLPSPRGLIVTLGIVVALAVIYQRLREWLMKLVQKLVLATGYDTGQLAAAFSKQIANILDIGELAIITGITLNQSVQPKHLGLLLLSPNEEHTQIDVAIGAGRLPTTPAQFAADSLLLKTFATRRHPLSQYDIDYNPQFRLVHPVERAWLRELAVDMYVPIYDGMALSAILAVGARLNGDPYRNADLKLLSAIADQASVALKNARLVTNLRALNERMVSLNEEMSLLNNALATSNERLRRLDEVKTDFINIASHELRTPLTTMRGYTDFLRELGPDGQLPPAELQSIIHQLTRACDRLEEVVSQMLDVSQIDVEAMQLNFTGTSIEATLKLVTDPFLPSLNERHQTLSVETASGLPIIQADFQRLVQALRHLVANAIKFTPDGGQISIFANHLPANADLQRPEAVEIVVADTGTGIDPEHHELIFEKFFRVGKVGLHSTGNTKFMGAGPGLGLTIARGVVRSHGGHIWVESPGYDNEHFPGSQFHIILPVVQTPFITPVPSKSQLST